MSLPRFESDEIDEYAVNDTVRFRRIRRRANEARDRFRRKWKIRAYVSEWLDTHTRASIEDIRNLPFRFGRSRRDDSVPINRRSRRRVREALRTGREFDVREYEEKLPYD